MQLKITKNFRIVPILPTLLILLMLLALLVPMSGCQQKAKGQQSVGVEKVKK